MTLIFQVGTKPSAPKLVVSKLWAPPSPLVAKRGRRESAQVKDEEVKEDEKEKEKEEKKEEKKKDPVYPATRANSKDQGDHPINPISVFEGAGENQV